MNRWVGGVAVCNCCERVHTITGDHSCIPDIMVLLRTK